MFGLHGSLPYQDVNILVNRAFCAFWCQALPILCVEYRNPCYSRNIIHGIEQGYRLIDDPLSA